MVDKLKFDENFFEETSKKDKNSSSKLKSSNTNHPLFDNNFNSFILSLNEESFPNCNQELNAFKSCKVKYNNNLNYLSHNLTSESNIEGLKKECFNEILFVYNCFKRFARFI